YLSPPLLILLLLLLFTRPSSTADPTLGPQAPVTIAQDPIYSSARPCAQLCVSYYGHYLCGFPGNYHDMNADLNCGCSPTNNCMCGERQQSPVSSYLTSCVSARCGGVNGWEEDLTSMVGLYDSYCATANVEVRVSIPTDGSALSITGPAANLGSATTAKRTGSASGNAAESTETPGAGAEEQKDEGLSKSDVIALSTALGIGIPSLLVGGVALWFQLRKR
ncbi:hypothetical protein P154DRAFT_418015, partial [Amniculicola lignicola CBS 123094]